MHSNATVVIDFVLYLIVCIEISYSLANFGRFLNSYPYSNNTKHKMKPKTPNHLYLTNQSCLKKALLY